MPRNQWSAKRERQYEHIKEGLEEQGRGEDLAEEIAARTVNKERARTGEAKTSSPSSVKDMSSGRRGGLRPTTLAPSGSGSHRLQPRLGPCHPLPRAAERSCHRLEADHAAMHS